MAIYDINGNLIMETSSVLGFRRDYSYITSELLCERKTLNNDGTLSASTSECVIYLPKTGLVEVRAQLLSGMFKVAKVSGSTVTWLVSDWSYYTYRYKGDGSSDYYCLVKLTQGASISDLTVDAAKDRIGVYHFVDVGEKYNALASLNGKHVAFIGDSITQGVFLKFPPSGYMWRVAKPFGGLIAEIANDMDYGNFGIGGAYLSGSGWDSVKTNCSKVTGYDVVFICAGTNDYGNNVAGATFTSDYQTVVDTLKANNTEVVACAPVYRTSKTGANTQGLTLQNYCDLIENVATAKGIKYLDLYTLTNDGSFITYCSDGLHPNEVGHKVIADYIISEYDRLSV